MAVSQNHHGAAKTKETLHGSGNLQWILKTSSQSWQIIFKKKLKNSIHIFNSSFTLQYLLQRINKSYRVYPTASFETDGSYNKYCCGNSQEILFIKQLKITCLFNREHSFNQQNIFVLDKGL